MTDPAAAQPTDPYRIGRPDEHLSISELECSLCARGLTVAELARGTICELCRDANPYLAGALLDPANRRMR